MIPRLGEIPEIEIKVISKPREAYQEPGHKQSGLPVAPAITLDENLLVQGGDIAEEKLVAIIKKEMS